MSALARAEYGKPATDKSASGRAAWSSAQTFAARILGALGDASDVERLTQDKVLYGAYTDMIIVARIEQRLGTIDHGRVVAMADNGATDRAAAAAILLHQAGIAHGSARLIELLHATGDARYLTWRQAWAAALSLPGARVDEAATLRPSSGITRRPWLTSMRNTIRVWPRLIGRHDEHDIGGKEGRHGVGGQGHRVERLRH
jgi:hypothetical protein